MDYNSVDNQIVYVEPEPDIQSDKIYVDWCYEHRGILYIKETLCASIEDAHREIAELQKRSN